MSEKTVIERTERPNTIGTLKKDLISLGLKTGDRVIVHTSLSRIGWISGGAVAYIDALLEVVGPNGTVVMPTQTADNSDPAAWGNPPVPKNWIPTIARTTPAFDADKTPTRGMGRVPEVFRKYPGAIRSNHPTDSFAALGKDARSLTQHHALSPGFGLDSPLGYLYLNQGKILLTGVGYDTCTALHLAECLSGVVPKRKLKTAMMEQGKRIWRTFSDYDYDSDDFPLLGKAYERERRVAKRSLGMAETRLIDLADLIDFAVIWMRKKRSGHGPKDD
ncbi:MAG: aminoglycoside N(3)-acetyltransferase [Acholeplasmataceae bacterium]